MPPPDSDVVALPLSTVRTLAGAAATSAHDRVDVLRGAGHAGGAELAAAFESSVRATDGCPADQLALEAFNQRVAGFFAQAGWGRVTISQLHDIVAAIDIADCWEPRAHEAYGVLCCHLTTGALAGFFGAYASYQLAALEVECAASGASHCRFLLGPPEVMDDLYKLVAAGSDYDAALAQISGASASA